MNLEKVVIWEVEYSNNKDKYSSEILLVYALPYVLVNYLEYNQDKEEYTLFASSDSYISESRYQGLRYYNSKTMSNLVEAAKSLKATKQWNKTDGKSYIVVHNVGDEFLWEGIYTNDAYSVSKVATTRPDWGKIPPLTTPWRYWHAYYLSKEKLTNKGPIESSKVESLWYKGLYLDTTS